MATEYDDKGKYFTDIISKTAITATVQTVVQKIEGSIHVRVNERITWNEGKITNARMTNYIVPTSLDAPPFTTLLVEALTQRFVSPDPRRRRSRPARKQRSRRPWPADSSFHMRT